MFTSNQKLEISGNYNQLKSALEFAIKLDGTDLNKLCYQITEDGKFCIGWFSEWKGYADNIWHDVAFYHSDDKAFWNGERPIPDVIKWAYVDEIIKD